MNAGEGPMTRMPSTPSFSNPAAIDSAASRAEAAARASSRSVRVDHSDARDRGQVESPCHELRADQDVGAAFAELLPDPEVGVGPARGVAVEPQHARLRPELLHHPLEPLRAHAEGADVAAAAVVANGRHLTRVAAVMAHEAIDLSVLHQRNRTAKTLHRLSAVTTHDVCREAAAVQVEDRLLLVVESLGDGLDQST